MLKEDILSGFAIPAKMSCLPISSHKRVEYGVTWDGEFIPDSSKAGEGRPYDYTRSIDDVKKVTTDENGSFRCPISISTLGVVFNTGA